MKAWYFEYLFTFVKLKTHIFPPNSLLLGFYITAIKCVRLSLGWCVRLLRPCLPSFVSQQRLLCPPPLALFPFVPFNLSPSMGCCVRPLSPFISSRLSPSIGCRVCYSFLFKKDYSKIDGLILKNAILLEEKAETVCGLRPII